MSNAINYGMSLHFLGLDISDIAEIYCRFFATESPLGNGLVSDCRNTTKACLACIQLMSCL